MDFSYKSEKTPKTNKQNKTTHKSISNDTSLLSQETDMSYESQWLECCLDSLTANKFKLHCKWRWNREPFEAHFLTSQMWTYARYFKLRLDLMTASEDLPQSQCSQHLSVKGLEPFEDKNFCIRSNGSHLYCGLR